MYSFRYLGTLSVVFWIISLYGNANKILLGQSKKHVHFFNAVNCERDDRRNEHVAEIIGELVKLHNKSSEILEILLLQKYSLCNDGMIDHILKTINHISILITDGKFKRRLGMYSQKKPKTYFIPMFNNTILDLLERNISSTWNPRALYICIAESKKSAVKIVTELWKKFVYNITVIIPTENMQAGEIAVRVSYDKENFVYETYTWRPYYPEGYCGPPKIHNIIRFGGTMKNKTYLYNDKIGLPVLPKKFKNCNLTIEFNVWEPYFLRNNNHSKQKGFEEQLLNLACNKLLARLNLIATISHKNLRMIPYDGVVGSIIPQLWHLDKADITEPYLQDSLVWVVPQVEQSLKWSSWIMCFSTETWLATGCTLICVAFMLKMIGERNYLLWTWGTLLENGIGTVYQSAVISFLKTPWILTCLHLYSAYKMVLLSLLVTNIYKNEILSQKDVLDSGLRMTFMDLAENYFDHTDPVDKEVLKRYVPCSNVPNCLKQVITDGNQAVFTNKMTAEYQLNRRNYSALYGFRLLKPSITYNVALVLRKGNPMIPGFNKYFRMVVEAGILSHWIQNVTQEYEQLSSVSSERRVLQLYHLKGVFALLTFGLNLATITWIIEILYYRWTKKMWIF